MSLSVSWAEHIAKLQRYMDDQAIIDIDDVALGVFDTVTKAGWHALCRKNGRDQSSEYFKIPDAGFPDWTNELMEDFAQPTPTGYSITFLDATYIKGTPAAAVVNIEDGFLPGEFEGTFSSDGGGDPVSISGVLDSATSLPGAFDIDDMAAGTITASIRFRFLYGPWGDYVTATTELTTE